MEPEEFIDRWRGNTRRERAASQQHFLELCQVLEVPQPGDRGATTMISCAILMKPAAAWATPLSVSKVTTAASSRTIRGPCITRPTSTNYGYFRGSFGGKDVIPLYRDATGTNPNVTGDLLETLGKAYGKSPSAEDIAAYVYAVLGGQSYTRRFWNELETPGPRVPITKNGEIFAKAAKLGRRLIWLHTYAERLRGDDRGEEMPKGEATTIKGVPSDPAQYPVEYKYDSAKREISVGDGRFGPVAPKVWEFEVSGLKVVQSWLGYRMKKRAGKKSSPLDDIRPERWTPKMSDEFLELLWVLEATLAMEPQLEKLLDQVVAGPCFAASELPMSMSDAIRQIGVTEVTYYRWRKEYGGMKTDQLKRLKELEKENERLRRAVSDLTLDKLILTEAAKGNF